MPTRPLWLTLVLSFSAGCLAYGPECGRNSDCAEGYTCSLASACVAIEDEAGADGSSAVELPVSDASADAKRIADAASEKRPSDGGVADAAKRDAEASVGDAASDADGASRAADSSTDVKSER